MGEWVVLELSARGEQEDPKILSDAITRSLKGAEVFVPAAVSVVGGSRTYQYLVDGYAFVRLDGRRRTDDFFKLEGTKFVTSVLVKPGHNRTLSTVSDDAVEKLQNQIRTFTDQGIGIGDVVVITTGIYHGLQADVHEEIPERDMVQVRLKLRSKEALLTIPRSALQVVERATWSNQRDRIDVLLKWTRDTRAIFCWNSLTPDFLVNVYRDYRSVNQWYVSGRYLCGFLAFDTTIRQQWQSLHRDCDDYNRLHRLESRGHLLCTFVVAYRLSDTGLRTIRQWWRHLKHVASIVDRLQKLWEEVDNLSRQFSSQQEDGGKLIHNVIVDGHALAYRCFYAKGLNTLTHQGEPSGAVLGFLRSLDSLRKRYSTAALRVAWDGSSARRKARYAAYKATRKSQDISWVVATLRTLLPVVGVRQHWNPAEEADDVIATLVRRDLVDQNNLIFSSDRDFLQLVTDRTHVLVPATGARNEVLFDSAEVSRRFGVPPGKMLELRAMFGDTSDNLSGVCRVPKKVLTDLLKAYGSVDRIYQSGLASVTKAQYARLQTAESTVKLNLELMSLQDVDVTTISAEPDQASATKRLQSIGIQFEGLLSAFFPQSDVVVGNDSQDYMSSLAI